MRLRNAYPYRPGHNPNGKSGLRSSIIMISVAFKTRTLKGRNGRLLTCARSCEWDVMRQADDAISASSMPLATPRVKSACYSFAAMPFAFLALAWFFCPVLVFDHNKQDMVGQMGGIVAVLMGVAGRQSGRKLDWANAGIVVGAVAFLLNFLLPTL